MNVYKLYRRDYLTCPYCNKYISLYYCKSHLKSKSCKTLQNNLLEKYEFDKLFLVFCRKVIKLKSELRLNEK